MSTLNATALTFKALHKPGQPLILANVHDGITANAVAALPDCHALATSSAGVAAVVGLDDDDLDIETNLRAIQVISKIAQQYQKPLTVDFQSGYGDQLKTGIERLIDLGVVGLNLEDVATETSRMYSIDEACDRIRTVMKVAAEKGVPDFVVNARADPLLHDGSIEETIDRGKAYLAAGATCVFVIGSGKRGGVSLDEVKQMQEAFEGRLSIMAMLANGKYTVQDLANAGVARCSIGSQIRGPVGRAAAEAASSLYQQIQTS